MMSIIKGRATSIRQNARVSVLPSKNTSISDFILSKSGLSRLSIGQKIGYGYALALGVAIFGTVAGFTIADYHQQQAKEKHDHAVQELELLNRLQNAVLQTRTHQQQFIPLAEKPELLQQEYAHFLDHAAEVYQLLSRVNSYISKENYRLEHHIDGIPRLLQKYQGVPEVYFGEVEDLVRQIEPPSLNKPEEIAAAQKLLLDFTNSHVALRFDGLSDDLTEVIDASDQDRTEAEAAVIAIERMRITIIAGSMLSSIAIAVILAFYTSRAITRPLKSVTNIAQQVTEEANFDLQVPVTTTDEVGQLANSLNHLIQQVKRLIEEQKAEAQARLIQSEKMSSLGRMIAGVAHEINNPVNFISGNLYPARDYIDDLFSLLETYKGEITNPPTAVQAKAEEIELEFLEEDLPKILQSMQVGADRIREIILSLKNFSRLDEGEVQLVDLHACIDSTLLILNNRLKNRITVVRNYGNIPEIMGYTGLLYQVFMNLLSNAIDALEEKSISNPQFLPEITITTERLPNDRVMVRIADNGSGIASEHQQKIFETFFTTKPRGIGTGLGLTISYQIVVEKHCGRITYESQLNKGTEFVIALPIYQQGISKPFTPKPQTAGISA